jgi:hypothetical protein
MTFEGQTNNNTLDTINSKRHNNLLNAQQYTPILKLQ